MPKVTLAATVAIATCRVAEKRTDRPVNRARRPPTIAAAMAARTTEAIFAFAPEPKNHGTSGMSAPRAKAKNDEPAAAHGEPSERGSMPSSSRGMSLERGLGVSHHLLRDIVRRIGVDAASHVDVRELDGLGVRVPRELTTLEGELALEQLALRLHRHVLAGGHRERPGDEAGEARGADDRRGRARAGDAEDQRHVRHEAVTDAEHGGARHAAGDVAMVVLDRRRQL